MRRLPAALSIVLLLAAACTTVVFEDTADRLRLLPNEVEARHAGRTVVWGGRLISLRRADDGYDLEVMAYPLDASNRPRLDAPAAGRFVAHFPGELSTTMFTEGGAVTLAGVLGDPRSAEIDGYQLVLPSVFTRRIHPWR